MTEYYEALQSKLLSNPDDLEVWEELYNHRKKKNEQEVIELFNGEQNKVEWTTEYINDLPDEAFALILDGGEKDEDGKTTPRNLRKLPHHTNEVESPTEDETVDWSHLINALARVNQVEDATEEELERAEAHLRAHFDRMQDGEDE